MNLFNFITRLNTKGKIMVYDKNRFLGEWDKITYYQKSKLQTRFIQSVDIASVKGKVFIKVRLV